MSGALLVAKTCCGTFILTTGANKESDDSSSLKLGTPFSGTQKSLCQPALLITANRVYLSYTSIPLTTSKVAHLLTATGRYLEVKAKERAGLTHE